MRAITGWLMAASGALAACGSDGGSHGEGPPTTVTVKTTGAAPDLVVFRNDADSTWQAATLIAPNQYSIVVTGPYWVSIACQPITHPDATQFMLNKIGRTLSDPTELDWSCDLDDSSSPPSALQVTGTLAQKAKLALGTTSASFTSDVAFQLQIAPGTYTLYAASADHYLAQPGVELTANVELPLIDVDAKGVAMVTTPFTITNPAKGTGLVPQAAVLIEDFAKFGDQPGLYTYTGDPATAKVVPQAALATGELQTVSIRELTTTGKGDAGRAYRRPFKVGDSTTFTLPDPIEGLTWSTDQGQRSAHWTSLPSDLPFRFHVSGNSALYTSHAFSIDVSPTFLSLTGATQVTAEINLPGLQGDWTADASSYSAQVFGQLGRNASIDPVISVWDEQASPILD